MDETRERVRINAKQTAKGAWQFDATFEDEAVSVDIDAAASKLLEAVNAAEKKFKADGKEVAGAE
jgi:hypothetical protein